MPALRDIQTQFLNTIFSETTDNIIKYIHANQLNGEQRLQVYRNNIFETKLENLRRIYPTIIKLVGDDFFRTITQHFIKNQPSSSGNLIDYGGNYSDFLETFEATTSIPYLSEIAELEWGYHQLFHAADSHMLDITRLNSISENQYPNLKFTLNPACKLFVFQYPIYHIWKMCHESAEQEGSIDLNQGGDNILLVRHPLELTIQIHKLSAGEFALLAALMANNTFAEACDNALKIQHNLDVTYVLGQQISMGTITDFNL